ncbi:Uncharacterised protein [Vibrio cholerae]|nr:Uncharacterised protein [Vibrio cholerae]
MAGLVIFSIFTQFFAERFRFEDVVTHRDQCPLRLTGDRFGIARFLFKTDHFAVFIHFNHPELRGLADRHTQCRNGQLRFHTAMKIEHLANIHLVDMV